MGLESKGEIVHAPWQATHQTVTHRWKRSVIASTCAGVNGLPIHSAPYLAVQEGYKSASARAWERWTRYEFFRLVKKDYCTGALWSRNLGSMPKISTHALSTLRKHTIASYGKLGECLGVRYWLPPVTDSQATVFRSEVCVRVGRV